jgi:hypothetical protein
VYGLFYPPGDHYCIKPPALQRALLEESWSSDTDPESNSTYAMECGLSAVSTPHSPRSIRRAVECCAYYFKRELGFDFVQYCSLEKKDDKHRAFLWVDHGTLDDKDRVTVIGACCFRLRKWSDVQPHQPAESYAFQWVWLHPYARRKGHLQKAWPYFCRRFGRIVPEPPMSASMVAFLKRNKAFPYDAPEEPE